MAETVLNALTRTEFGKGAARRTRRAGMVPAVIHSRGETPVHVSLPGHGAFLALRHANAVMEIDIDGNKTLTLAREVQRHPVTDVLVHVDLMAIKAGEKIEAGVPIRIEGEPTVGLALLDLQELLVLVEATNIPDYIAVNVDGLVDGATVHVKDLQLPEGVEVVTDLEAAVVNVTVPRMEEEETFVEEGEAVEGEEAAEEAAAEE